MAPSPSCWICLDNDPDDEGKPIVRDCACRGSDQGYAHISCIVDYAKSQNSSLQFKDLANYVYEIQRPWKVCCLCKQCYCNEVAMELATGLLNSYTDIGSSSSSNNNTTTSNNINPSDPTERMFQRIAALQMMGSTVADVSTDYPKAIQYFKLVTDFNIKKNQPSEATNNRLVQMMIKHQSLLAYKDISECYAHEHHYKDALVARKRCVKLSEEVMGNEGQLHIQEHKIKVEFYQGMVNLANQVKPEYRHMLNHMYQHSTQAMEVKSKQAKASYELLVKKYDDGSKEQDRLDILNAKAYYGSTLCTLSEGRNPEGFRLMKEATELARQIYGMDHPSATNIEFQYQKVLTLFGNNRSNSVPADHEVDAYQPKMIATIVNLKTKNGLIENGKQVEVIKQRNDGKYQVRLLGGADGQVFKASTYNLKFYQYRTNKQNLAPQVCTAVCVRNEKKKWGNKIYIYALMLVVFFCIYFMITLFQSSPTPLPY